MQGDYSIRRLSAAAVDEARELQAQGTPNPDHFIAAYPGTAGRGGAWHYIPLPRHSCCSCTSRAHVQLEMAVALLLFNVCCLQHFQKRRC
jgi:hypothetical protein